MQIIIPMSGSGQRFRAKGYHDIKPLIPVGGRPIIDYVIKLFPGETDFIFICNEEHLATTPLRQTLHRLMPSGKIIGIAPHKHGPVWAVLQAENAIQPNEPTIVNYCDFNCVWDYADFKQVMQREHYDGAVVCYKGFHPHLLGPNKYAGCRVDEHNRLLEIREKYSFTENLMDSYQSSGTYYFGSGQLLLHYFQQQVDGQLALNGEYYVSLAYQLLLRDHLKVGVYEIEQFCQWGTPEDLAEFVYWSEYFQTQNKSGV